ncbi:hypothetical protein BaRGS_00021957 [Batillaria attramentaria]|uniref:Ig-like domain-containing protein n=1 Tax=Batillaria attramentaria TaxID=370345 RepID=A0ABD0KHX7_9CAEN
MSTHVSLVSTETVKLEITPATPKVILPVGETLQLNCTGNQRSRLTWYKLNNGTRELFDKLGNLTLSEAMDNDTIVSILSNRRVDVEDGGTYLCSDQNSNVNTSVDVLIVTVETKDGLLEDNEGATISCSVDTSDNVTYTWEKNRTKVSELPAPDDQKFVEHDNGTLEFTPATTQEDAGVYECKMKVGTSEFSSSATLYAKPYVARFDKPFNERKSLVQEERLHLRCKVLGYPTPSISWFKDDVEIQADEEGSRYILSEYNGFPNARLKIESVDSDDEGHYKCVATASHIMFDEPNMTMPVSANDSRTIFVRVIDKNAALWPFLGLVVEVVIVCTIIFICEKKRNKNAANEDAVNQDEATPKKSKKGVRHRGNTNNLRA